MSDALSRASGKSARMAIASPLHAIRLPDGDPLTLSLLALEHAIVQEVTSAQPTRRDDLLKVVSDAAGVMGLTDPQEAALLVVDGAMNARRGFKPFTQPHYRAGVGLADLSFSLLEERYSVSGALTIRASDEARSLVLSMLQIDDIDAEALIRLATELAVADGALDHAVELAATLRLQCDHNLLAMQSRIDAWRAGLSDDEGLLALVARALDRSSQAPTQLRTLVDRVAQIDSADAHAFTAAMGEASAAAARLRQYLWRVHSEATAIIAQRLSLVPTRSVPLFDIARGIGGEASDVFALFARMNVPRSVNLFDLAVLEGDAVQATDDEQRPAVFFAQECQQAEATRSEADQLIERLLLSGQVSAGQVALIPAERSVLRSAISRLYYWLVTNNDERIESGFGPRVVRAVYDGSNITAQLKESVHAFAA